MMNELREIDPREKLRRLVEALDEEPPGEEEAREVVAALNVDIPAMAARIRARATAHAGGDGALAALAAERRRVARRRNVKLGLAVGVVAAAAGVAAAVALRSTERPDAKQSEPGVPDRTATVGRARGGAAPAGSPTSPRASASSGPDAGAARPPRKPSGNGPGR
jgi:hypothetical protein